jgi:hypothetical protein
MGCRERPLKFNTLITQIILIAIALSVSCCGDLGMRKK